MASPDPLEEAGGYFALGMFSDAWEATEELPPEDRTSEPALVIRLQTLTAIAQWDLGNHVASLLIYAGEGSRQTVAMSDVYTLPENRYVRKIGIAAANSCSAVFVILCFALSVKSLFKN